MDYKEAGVDIEEGYRAVSKYRELAKIANGDSAAMINGLGSFAGMFSLKELIAAGEGMDDPVLVSGTDGVGTKLEIAFKLKKYDTVGIDCVAMCVNDILCHGAKPLFFLDYLACGKLDADVAASLVKGVADGCRETGSVLLGGETAEMPGFYDEGKYDIAGFAVGLADRKRIVDGSKVREGDVLIGLASSGPHSNGFSLIRRAIPNLNEDFAGKPIGLAFLEPTRLYVKPVLGLLEEVDVRGMANITGGGFYENIPRMFRRNSAGSPAFDAVINEGTWPIPPIFARIAVGITDLGVANFGIADSGGTGDASAGTTGGAGTALNGAAALAAGEQLLKTDADLKRLLFNTFNMGVGFVIALAKEDAKRAIAYLGNRGFPAWEIGRVEAPKSGAGVVRLV
ncbi:phosphoribosylformylglycinamidine cyclo-ligase [Spirochaetia bacterium]|nr:phosphoribosylformylglycinamidine cyclo-ligase [Spirochaetia bacterium]